MANLNSTQLANSIGAADQLIPLVSVANINKNDVLYIQDLAGTVGEAMPIVQIFPTLTPPIVKVTRSGAAASHGPASIVYTGAPALFQTVDPKGVPPIGQQFYWINTKTGVVWVAQGDEAGPGALNRYWQPQVSTPSKGALGARVFTVAPTQSPV